MKKVLVTTDLSANSRAGIRFAIQLQKQTGCSLVFYHAVEILKPTSWNDRKFKAFADEKKAEFVARLIAFVGDVFAAAGVSGGKNSYRVELGTRVAAMTVACAQAVKADAICTATRGAGRFAKLLGSVATALLTESPLPVVIVPPKYRAEPLEDVYYATDLEYFARELRTVRTFADRLGARVGVVHYDFSFMDKAAVKALEKRYSRYASSDVKFLFRRRYSEATIAESFRKDLKKERPDLLVLFTKLNKNWFRRIFQRSKTKQLALHPTVPLLVYRKKPR